MEAYSRTCYKLQCMAARLISDQLVEYISSYVRNVQYWYITYGPSVQTVASIQIQRCSVEQQGGHACMRPGHWPRAPLSLPHVPAQCLTGQHACVLLSHPMSSHSLPA